MHIHFGTATMENDITVEETKTNNDPRPTVQQVLEWARHYQGIVLDDWSQNPTRQVIGRIVLPERAGSSKSNDTSNLVKDAINSFYPNVNAGKLFKNACYVNVQSGGSRITQIMILESNLQIKQTWTDFTKGLAVGMLFPSYAAAKRTSSLGTFLKVEGILIQNLKG